MKNKIRKGEIAADSKRIAFYLVLQFTVKPSEAIRDTIQSDFEADQSGLIYAKPIFGNLIQFQMEAGNEYAATRNGKAWIFLRKANIEHQFKTEFAK